MLWARRLRTATEISETKRAYLLRALSSRTRFGFEYSIMIANGGSGSTLQKSFVHSVVHTIYLTPKLSRYFALLVFENMLCSFYGSFHIYFTVLSSSMV
jgi:hypothetical protein